MLNRTAVVRVHGYKTEVELSIEDLEPSLGQREIQQQVQQAELYQVKVLNTYKEYNVI